MLKFADIRLRPKMLGLLLIFGILPMIAVAIHSSRLSSEALIEKSYQGLSSIQSLRISAIDDFFRERLSGLDTLAHTGQLSEFIEQVGSEHEILPSIIASRYDPFFTSFVDDYGYDDLVILKPESGELLYSLTNRNRVGIKLSEYTGDPALKQAWSKTMNTRKPIFSDFGVFNVNDESKRQQNAYLSSPIWNSNGEMTAVIAVRILPDLINDIVNSRIGMGATGESYIIGLDNQDSQIELRSDITTMGNGSYRVGYRFEKDLDYWNDAIDAGTSGGKDTYVDSSGHPVLVVFNQLNVPGYQWFLISKINEDEVTHPITSLYQAVIVATAALILLVIFVAVKFSRSVTEPLIESMKFAKDISAGTLSSKLTLQRKDELGDLGIALNGMAVQLRELDWIKSGKEGLDDKLRGDIELSELSSLFINFFTKHMGCQLGALYLFEEEKLHLRASYCFTDRQGNFNQLALGEGMVGQAALEQETIIFSDMTHAAPTLNYGVGETSLKSFMSVPLIVDGHLVGVVLLGSTAPFTSLQKQFVKDVINSAAILFDAANARLVIRTLLEQAQKQQENLSKANDGLKESEQALQNQQEELRVTNEELEEQTKVLKESEAELQAQQEELRVTNEELEERTKALEEQQVEMQGKNDQLHLAQNVVEEKAKELASASKYKSEFLANMSHELRTPLNSILILSQLLASNKAGNLNDKQIESAKAINSSGSDLLSLINEVLDLSKVEAGKVELQIEDVSFQEIEQDINRLYQDIAVDKGLYFDIALAADLPNEIKTDSLRLQQILRNLLTNAFKFTHEGAVTLSITQPTNEVAARMQQPKQSLVAFTVKDDGIGIKKEKQLGIFQAFQQADGSTSRKYGGTGLGLSISKELTHLLGGTILLKSDEGKGCAFTVVLPLEFQPKDEEADKSIFGIPIMEKRALEPEELQPLNSQVKSDADINTNKQAENTDLQLISQAAAIPSVKLNVKDESYIDDDRLSIAAEDQTLLIIEDDRAFAGVMRDFGRERGFKCIVAETGETGLHFADYYKPSAIILDIGLPGIDGWTVMERLKENSELRHIPVHFMSASDNNLDAMRMGAIGYLTKPVDLNKLNKTFGDIEEIIAKSVKKLLIVEDDEIQRESIRQLLGEGDIHIVGVATGKQALQELETNRYDCMILDLGLEDLSGFELLDKIRRSDSAARVPIIVYTGRELTVDEEKELSRYAESIIIKGVKSPERLLDESALFLHRVESRLPAEQRGMLKAVHDKETVLAGKKILLVDDDMRNVFALSSILEDKGIEIVVGRDGLESIEKLDQHPDIALILMDIMMPKMDGYDAMKEIRKKRKYKKLPIIALTAKAMKGDRSKCIEAGASDYLAKPVDTDKLLSMLRVWLY
ncbi:Histidine kinase [Shewanella sediminis HAW-EB3]|uniref:histidine kinase n=1 Tax=Shewanella sediminis (strain HAW-EB3) TaxID=425104 RepID=A8FTT6_SHESH|nr:response regulator [Shewanella sediminis]ABV36259.1 Histidine kinase [Shewanella sediminis HAW-EB3]